MSQSQLPDNPDERSTHGSRCTKRLQAALRSDNLPKGSNHVAARDVGSVFGSPLSKSEVRHLKGKNQAIQPHLVPANTHAAGATNQLARQATNLGLKIG